MEKKAQKTLSLILSLFIMMSIFGGMGNTRAASPMLDSTRNDLDINTLLQPIIDVFNSLFNMIKAPFVALQDIIMNWGNSVSGMGIWAPLIAVVVLMITLFVLFLGTKLAGWLP